MTVITGTAPRAYELAERFRRARHPGGAGRPACDADARRRPAARRRDRRRLCRGDAGRNCCAISRPAACSRATTRRPDSDLAGRAASRAAICCRARRSSPTTSSRPRAAASTTATSASCPRPGGRSRSRSRSRRWSPTSASTGARKLIFVDLNLIADRDYAAPAVRGADPAASAVVRPGHDASGRRRAAARASPRAAAARAC